LFESEEKTVALLKKLAALFYRQGDVVNALQAYNKVLSFHPEDAEIRMIVGDLYMKDKSYLLAVESYDEVLKSHPSNVPAIIRIADAKLALGDKLKAEELYLFATMKNKFNVQALYAFAKFLVLEKRELRIARDYLGRAYEIDPTNIDVLMLRAHIARKFGDFEFAEGLYRRVLELDPDNKSAFDEFRSLENGGYLFRGGDVPASFESVKSGRFSASRDFVVSLGMSGPKKSQPLPNDYVQRVQNEQQERMKNVTPEDRRKFN